MYKIHTTYRNRFLIGCINKPNHKILNPNRISLLVYPNLKSMYNIIKRTKIETIKTYKFL